MGTVGDACDLMAFIGTVMESWVHVAACLKHMPSISAAHTNQRWRPACPQSGMGSVVHVAQQILNA